MDLPKCKLPDKCEICLKVLKDPKVLPCFHIACRECVRGVYVKGRVQVNCPVDQCGKPITCTGEDPELLPDALFIYHKRDLQGLRSKVEKGDVCCELCYVKNSEEPAVASCDQCRYICRACCKRHEKEVMYSDHNVVSFFELSNKKGDDLHYEVLKRSRSKSFVQQRNCRLHPHWERKSYCLDCKLFVCSSCIDDDHAKHHYKAIDIAAKECRDRINEALPSIDAATKKIVNAMESVERQKVSIKDQEGALSIAIDEEFERIKKVLLKRQQELHDKLKAQTKFKLGKLYEQKKKMDKLVQGMERMIAFVFESFRTSTEYEILNNFGFLEDRVNEYSCGASEMNLDPVEVPNTALLKCVELSGLRKSLEVYSKQADPSFCTVEGKGTKSAETMCYSTFVVNVPDKNGQPCSTVQDVRVRITCCENDCSFSAQVRDTGMGRYSASFCPEFRGKHNIFVDVNGKSIIGSPFTLKVHTSLFQLGCPKKCIENINQPRGITMTPKGKLLICQWNGSSIIEMDTFGELCNEMDTKHMQLASLTLDSSGHIFIAVGALENCGILKCNKDGRIVKSVLQRDNGGQHMLKNPRGIAISPQNMLFVCDKNDNRIQVYDTDLNFVRSINLDWLGQEEFQKKPLPNDLAFDRTGKMFVTDYANHCVHVFGPSERYLFSFSQAKQDNLGRPECICIDDYDYIYVSESEKHRISVFHTSGEFVTTFGKKGSEEGEFKFPTGLAVDEYGTVFVCDLYNNRIQVF